MPRKRAKTSAEKIRLTQRRAAVINYRLQGYSVTTIAKGAGVSTSTVHKDITAALKDMLPYETREQLLQQELHRLDMMMTAFYSNAVEGDLPAADMVLKIQNQRARLCGLYPDSHNGAVSLNFGGTQSSDGFRDFNLVFVTPTPRDDDGNPIDGSTPSATVHQFRPKLVEHIPDPPPSVRNAVPPPNEHQVYDASKRLPDPIGPRTELDVPRQGQSAFRKPSRARTKWDKPPDDAA